MTPSGAFLPPQSVTGSQRSSSSTWLHQHAPPKEATPSVVIEQVKRLAEALKAGQPPAVTRRGATPLVHGPGETQRSSQPAAPTSSAALAEDIGAGSHHSHGVVDDAVEPSPTRARLTLAKQDRWAAAAAEAKLAEAQEQAARREARKAVSSQVKVDLQAQMTEHEERRAVAQREAQEYQRKLVDDAASSLADERRKHQEVRQRQKEELDRAKRAQQELEAQRRAHRAQLIEDRKAVDSSMRQDEAKAHAELVAKKEKSHSLRRMLEAHFDADRRIKQERTAAQRASEDQELRAAMEAEEKAKLTEKQRLAASVSKAQEALHYCQSMSEAHRRVEEKQAADYDTFVLKDADAAVREEAAKRVAQRTANGTFQVALKQQILRKEEKRQEERFRALDDADMDPLSIRVLPTEESSLLASLQRGARGGASGVRGGIVADISPSRSPPSPSSDYGGRGEEEERRRRGGAHSSLAAMKGAQPSGAVLAAHKRQQDAAMRQWKEELLAQADLHRAKRLAGHLVTSIARSSPLV